MAGSAPSARFRIPAPAEAARWRLPAVLTLSLLALLVVLVGAPGGLAVVLVGAFMLAAPGLLLAEVLPVGDTLLALVLAMMAGPVLWVVLPTAEVFAGVWHPEVTVGVVAAGARGGRDCAARPPYPRACRTRRTTALGVLGEHPRDESGFGIGVGRAVRDVLTRQSSLELLVLHPERRV